MYTIMPNIEKKQATSISTHNKVISLIDQLYISQSLQRDEFRYILNHITQVEKEYLFQKAFAAKQPYYGKKVYLRALIEISNYCTRGCKYCGISRLVKTVKRYRLTEEEILECVDIGYTLGYRTFVLQGGEDPYFSDEVMVELIREIKTKYPDSRVTLSLGEKEYASYKKLYEAGADRYLLRHETASKRLYEKMHSEDMSFEKRIECLWNLKKIGYQVGAGFMVGLPTQTNEDLVEDLMFLKELDPHMIGIGPYLCHSDTVLKGNDDGTLDQTLVMVALTRLLLPKALMPATTALGTLSNTGREQGLLAGANVIMPNISPTEFRKLYEIYQNKICTGDTSVQCRGCVELRIKRFGHDIDLSVGDYFGL
jgi:biotin synthase